MKSYRWVVVVFLAISVMIASMVGQSPAVDKASAKPAPLADRIASAAPDKPTAAPRKARKLVVFTFQPGYKHACTPAVSAAIALLGQRTGAWETTVTDDLAMMGPASLRQFDAVVLNNNCGPFFLPPGFAKLTAEQQKQAKAREAELRKGLEDFVRSGGGLVGLHSCLYAPDYATWPEGGEMIGGLVASHPWTKDIRVLLDDPGHPLCAAFGGKPFEIREETYEVKGPYSREKVHVLLRLDMTTVDPSKGSRKDGDYALAWVKSYGKGRVFYSALTHFEENLAQRPLLRFYLDGIQFALGDLEASMTPSAGAK